jgi:anti-anti-sigma factor
MGTVQTLQAQAPLLGGVSAVRDGGRIVVALSGEHDLSTVGVIDATLTEATATGLDVVVDLGAVEFMDASTVRVLVDGGARVAERGRRLSLRAAHGLPRRLLDICGLNAMVDPDPPMSDARPAPTTALETWVPVPVPVPVSAPDRVPAFVRASEPDDPERADR